MRFLIRSAGYFPTIGGSIALHKLADNLRACGETAVMSYNGEVPEKEDVVVYPETISGNPLNAEKVVRWILSPPGQFGKDRRKTFGEGDLIFGYAPHYVRGMDCDGIMGAYDWHFADWYDTGERRCGTCFIVRKGRDKRRDKHPAGSLQLDGYKDNAYLRWAFNRHQRFISYDEQTMLLLQAALCGCESQAVPGELPEDEWRKGNPFFKYGVAYGPDMAYARATSHLVRGHLEELVRESLQQTKEFIATVKELL